MGQECKCKGCGSTLRWDDLKYVTVYEDYGDVSCLKCPECGRIQYDGFELFVDVDEERSQDCRPRPSKSVI